MKYMRSIVYSVCIFGAACVTVGIFLLVSYKYSDQISRSYPTLASAQDDINKGWIPPILPPSTYDIKDSHNLDVNTGAGTFHFDPKEMDFFSQHGMRARPITTESDTEDQKLNAAGYQFGTYSEDKTTWILAVHTSGNGYYWLKYENK